MLVSVDDDDVRVSAIIYSRKKKETSSMNDREVRINDVSNLKISMIFEKAKFCAQLHFETFGGHDVELCSLMKM